MLEIGYLLLFCYGFFMVHPVFWVVVALVAYLYYQLSRRETRLLGQQYNSIGWQLLPSLLAGLGGGVVASLLLVLPGFSLHLLGIPLMFVTALLLLTVNPRFLCFAYSVGIVSLVIFLARGWLFYFPHSSPDILNTLAEISIPGMLVLVAVLHLTESLLIFTGGHWGASPVFFKGTDKKIMGGFMLQRFWLVPLVLLVIMPHPPFPVQGPEWWPLIDPNIAVTGGGITGISLIPAPVVMGYADMAVSSRPREKSIYSASYLAVYSILLLGIAFLAVYFTPATIAGVLFAPLGHEMVVLLGNRREMSGEPRYIPPAGGGARILAVYPGSPAERAGLLSEDVIREVNGEKVLGNYHFWQLLWGGYFWAHLRLERNGIEKTLVLQRLPQEKPPDEKKSLWPFKKNPPSFRKNMGIILVPDSRTSVYLEARKYAPLSWLKNRLFYRRQRL